MDASATRGQSMMVTLVGHFIRHAAGFEEAYFWHRAPDRYTKFVAEYFLRRSNRSTISRNLPSFLERFPTCEDLCGAPIEDVLEQAHWAGLQRRTAALPGSVSMFLARQDWTVDDLKGLPYIGQYAAEALGLYVCGLPEFPVDNNVRRVFSRYFGLNGDSELELLVEEAKGCALASGGISSLRALHQGTLAMGWSPCAPRPRCAECQLAPSCRYARLS